MRGLPEFLTMVDEIYDVLESPKVSTPSCPILLLERPVERTRPFKGCRRWRPVMPVESQKSTKSTPSERDFSVVFDVSSFNPEDISVKLVDREIFIDGKHEEREDEYGFISRQFSRRITLPKDFDTDTITILLTKDGKMTIKASRPKPLEPKERIIPIKRIASDEAEEIVCKKPKEGKTTEKEAEMTSVEE